MQTFDNKSFNKINNIFGWLAFAVAAIVYLVTMEPTASFWDCGEFIASGNRLEVGHPPGSPIFMLIIRFFTMFAPSKELIPVFANAMSALASAFTIIFLFWTISHIARKVVNRTESSYSSSQVILIIASGLIGALAYTFSDTFWFSAVEGEVYASSSLFTAMVFWAILKWENVADSPFANRWIILIAYLMGLSIGVHLLNLLAIPAIVMVFYFKKYEVTKWGVIKALIVGFSLLLASLVFVIKGYVVLASKFELLFVNGFGLPYNSGVLFYLALVIGLLIYGISYTYKHEKVIANTILLGLTVMVMGYSSYALTVIRSSAKPPMNQNAPDNMYSLLYYLNREQYGDSPLIYGQSFNAPVIGTEEGAPSYIPKDGKYIVAGHKTKYLFDERFMTVFPRMYSSEANHVKGYKQWTEYAGIPIKLQNNSGKTETRYAPKLSDQVKYFWNYQMGFMYWRYFMWNFAGRQNDIQGNGDALKGNWISGIPIIDNTRLGPQEDLPSLYKNNKARNRYFLLPLILGIAGIFYLYKRNQKDFWVVTLLFVLTGLAIVVYLNQKPFEPRERDYAYAGSFYAFAIWIGLGVLALYELAKKWISDRTAAIASGAVCLTVPIIMCNQNWDDHNRSGRYTSVDFGYNMLIGCAPNAVLFTYGDNDTFPLWYNQEVEGVRQDVRVSNLNYLRGDWYIDQMKRKAYTSDPLPLTMTHDKYYSGKRDYILVSEQIKGAIDLRQAISFIYSDDAVSQVQSPYSEKDKLCFIPSNLLFLPVDKDKAIKSGTVSPELADEIVDTMVWKISEDVIMKEGLVVLDLLATNNWERPIYMGTTVSNDSYQNLERYFQLEGMMYRIAPIESKPTDYDFGRVDTKVMYDNIMNKYRFRSIANPNVYLDENNSRIISNYRSIFARLAGGLIDEGKKDLALTVLNRCMEVIPPRNVPFNYLSLSLIENYYRADAKDKAITYSKVMLDNSASNLKYILNLSSKKIRILSNEIQLNMAIIQELYRLADRYDKGDHLKEIEKIFSLYASKLESR
ncbi:MAG: DUF2723 domain-containing protein [Bacteroidales bacterium]|nr:MAG: DUF2723 domain-containing protein [Bacteroidales bacterium]